MRSLFYTIPLLLSTAVGGLSAQSGSTSACPDSAVLHRMSRIGELRVTTARGRTVVRGSAVSDSGIRITSDSAVAWGDIRRVDAVRSPVVTGMIVGASLFGVTGFIVGVAATGPCGGGFGFELCGASSSDVAVMTLAGVGIGALLGLIVSAPFTGWKPVYDTASGKGVRLERPTPAVTVGSHGEPRLGLALNLRF